MLKLFIRNKFVEVVNFFYSGITDLRFNAIALSGVIVCTALGVVLDLIFGMIKHGLRWWEIALGYVSIGFFTILMVGCGGVFLWAIYTVFKLMYREFKGFIQQNWNLANAGIKVKFAWKK